MKEVAEMILAIAALLLVAATIPLTVGLLFDIVGNERERRARLEAQRRADRYKEITERVVESVLTSKGVVSDDERASDESPRTGVGAADSHTEVES